LLLFELQSIVPFLYIEPIGRVVIEAVLACPEVFTNPIIERADVRLSRTGEAGCGLSVLPGVS
jgi:hypothetical protein